MRRTGSLWHKKRHRGGPVWSWSSAFNYEMKNWRTENKLGADVEFKDLYQNNGDGYEVWRLKQPGKKERTFTVKKPFCQHFL